MFQLSGSSCTLSMNGCMAKAGLENPGESLCVSIDVFVAQQGVSSGFPGFSV